MIRALVVLLLSLAGLRSEETILWYGKPARNWETEALPIGNGQLGAMLFGDPVRERIQFNEESLWIGDEKDTGAYQAFGDVIVHFEKPSEPVSRYRRQLDIDRAVQVARANARVRDSTCARGGS